MKKLVYSLFLLIGANLMTPVFGSSGSGDMDTIINVLDGKMLSELWLLIAVLLVILFLGLVITIMAFTKDPKKLSFNYLSDSIQGLNADDEEMDHAFDGVLELNNPVPAWLRLILYASIVFGFIYFPWFHMGGLGKSSVEAYEAEMAWADNFYKDVELEDKDIIALTDVNALEAGKEIFIMRCSSCHTETGGGDIGPNLTDNYWLHGGSLLDIYRTVTNGVPQNGMVAWKDQLTSKQRLQVSNYIQNLKGTNPPNPKEKEGKLYSPESETTKDSTNINADSTKIEKDSLQN